ncbi:His-Xaa-Ser system radical SAM maturase HxsB [Novisyntrophococcus fermenticellae]|uniref:His-Xaa-Ser system radical SAM maturase HxsB n=1 Tax=Novisyntrophococcus fermenticellae TaxID=2068655 RepID=UPI001E2E24EC|nr:His-Xaa-Ser system radical SAM maturase HxsB [Novisyntrophococcus fermenticellae]
MLNHFNFEKRGDKVLLTNDFGKHIFLEQPEFKKLVTNKIEETDACYDCLKDGLFIFDNPMEVFTDENIDAIRGMKGYLFTGTALHIFVVTNVCNMNCIYCQAKDKTSDLSKFMTPETGRRAVDMALQSPVNELTFEFQGGEPLLNFKTIKAMIDYCEERKGSKNVEYTLVSNLIALTDDKLDYLAEHHVSVSTSMDGPQFINDHNRVAKGGLSSYEYMDKGLKKLKERGISSGAIETTTRYSLGYPEEIINAYYEKGLPGIFLRPLTPLGFAQADWETVGYAPDEFLLFYSKAFEKILEINRGGTVFPEILATYFLRKIMNGVAYNYMELRSPCGASMGQMSYYCDGDIYTCDEGRMISETGDHAFRLGNVYENTYQELLENPVCKATALSSVVESLPSCQGCVYQPYCGVCPVVNYAEGKNIFPKQPGGFRCQVYKGILNLIFQKIQEGDWQTMNIFETWIEG